MGDDRVAGDPDENGSDDPSSTPNGVRAGLAVHELSNCPVAAVSRSHDGPVSDIAWTRTDGTHTEEFRVRDPDAVAATDEIPDADPVVDLGAQRVYRYDRPVDGDCACQVIESLDCPIVDARAEDGVLYITLHLPDLERLRDVVAALDGVADRVAVRYLLHGSGESERSSDRTVVDRGRLTNRQCEVLRTAHRMGYFERPRDANAGAVAEALDIAPSTFAEHLAAAQRKLLDEALVQE